MGPNETTPALPPSTGGVDLATYTDYIRTETGLDVNLLHVTTADREHWYTITIGDENYGEHTHSHALLLLKGIHIGARAMGKAVMAKLQALPIPPM